MNAFRASAATALFVAFALFGPADCQVVVQEGVSTDTVDLFAKSSKPQKSMVLAMCASIVLPGLGQQYLGDNTKALAYYSAEALFIVGAVFCSHYSRTVFDNAKAFAWDHAEAQGGAGANDQYWQNVADYDESDGYNQSLSLGYNKEAELIYRSQAQDYLTSNLQWHWDDTSNRTIYGGMLQQSMGWQVASSFFIGAMVLNRLVSFIDARFTARHMEAKSLSSLQFVPRYDPGTRASGVALQAGF